jgi:hypothetical protein
VVQVHLAAGAPGCSESHILHRVINKMLPILPALFYLILVKFGVGDLHIILLSTCAVEAIVHVAVYLNFAYIFYSPPAPIWVHCHTADGHKNLLSDYEFSKNQCSKKHTLFEGIIEFIVVLCMFII